MDLADVYMTFFLPERQAGMLRVRRKGSDVVMMLLVGVALVVLAVVVPDQPGAP